MQSLSSSACYDEIKAAEPLLLKVIQHSVHCTVENEATLL